MQEGLYEVGDVCRTAVSGRIVKILDILPTRGGRAGAYVWYVDLCTKLILSQKNLIPL